MPKLPGVTPDRGFSIIGHHVVQHVDLPTWPTVDPVYQVKHFMQLRYTIDLYFAKHAEQTIAFSIINPIHPQPHLRRAELRGNSHETLDQSIL